MNTFYMKFWHFSASLQCQNSHITTFMILRQTVELLKA